MSLTVVDNAMPENGRAPVKRDGCLTPAEMDFMIAVARQAEQSGIYKRLGNASGVFMILMAARELGVSPVMALNGGIWNIDGKIEISARLMNGLIRKAGHQLKVLRQDNKGCIIEGKRRDTGEVQSASFTEEDAKAARLTVKDNWVKYAEDMYFARALSRLARRLFPDLIGTAYVEGELIEAEGSRLPAEESQVAPIVNYVSPEVAAEIEALISTSKPGFKDTFDKLIRDRYKAVSYEQIPAEFAPALIEALKRNQQLKEAEATE